MEWMFMPLRRYAEFSGRSRRMEFWMWQVFKMLVYAVLMVLIMVFGGAVMLASSGGEPNFGALGAGVILIYLLFFLFSLAVIIPDIAVTIRRLHDTNRSGFWILAPLAGYLVAIVGVIAGSRGLMAIGYLAGFVLAVVLLVFYFLDGTPGDNRYGADPKARGEEQVFA